MDEEIKFFLIQAQLKQSKRMKRFHGHQTNVNQKIIIQIKHNKYITASFIKLLNKNEQNLVGIVWRKQEW